MRKIVFAVPREEDPVIFAYAPLAILSLAKQVKQAGFEPVILDAKQIKDDFLPRLEKEFRDDPVLLWCSGKTGRQLKDLCDAGRLAKQINPDLPVVFGGWHAQMAVDSTLNTPYVDYVVKTQGETTLPELARRFAAREDVTGMDGVSGKSPDGRQWHGKELDWVRELDTFGPLPWEMVDMEFYITGDNGRCQPMVVGAKRTINYTYSRGCHGMCSFCHITALWNRGWFSQTPKFVLDEIGRLVNEFKVEGIDFHDSNFFTGQKRAMQIVDGIIERGYQFIWKCSVRADQVNAMSDSEMERITKAGCTEFAIGAEGGTNRVMGLVAKEIVPSDVIECSHRCAKWGILPEYSFMVGFPDEKNWDDSKATLAFMARLRQIAPNALAEYFYYTPFPGTPLFKDYAQRFMPKHETLEDYVNFSTYAPNMPWVDDKLPVLLKMATRFYFKFAIPNSDLRRKMAQKNLMGLGLRMMTRISNWRVQKRVYAFPIEYRLARFVKDVLIGKLGVMKKVAQEVA